MTNSQRKGKKGELEWARFLREHGIRAHRGRQYEGSAHSPDVKSELDGFIHWEVKRVERFMPYSALEQALMECGEAVPVVAHRPNKKRWTVFMDAEHFLTLLNQLMEGETCATQDWNQPGNHFE